MKITMTLDIPADGYNTFARLFFKFMVDFCMRTDLQRVPKFKITRKEEYELSDPITPQSFQDLSPTFLADMGVDDATPMDTYLELGVPPRKEQ